MAKAGGNNDFNLYLAILHQARPYWPHIVGLFLLGLLATPISLLTPLPLKVAVDSVIGSAPLPDYLVAVVPAGLTQSPLSLLIFATGLLVAVALVSQLQALTSNLLRTYVSEKLVLEFRSRLFNHVQRLSFAFHDEHGTSDVSYRIQYDTAAVQYIAIDGVIPFITATLTLVAMLYVVFQLDWMLALVALGVTPVLVLSSHVYRRRYRDSYREAKDLESSALSVIQEVLTALRVVKAFGQEDREHQRFVERHGRSTSARFRLAWAEGVLGAIMGLTTTFGTAAVMYLGTRHVLNGSLTLGELLLVVAYLTQLYNPMKTVVSQIASLQSHLASAERALSLLDRPHDVVQDQSTRRLERAVGRLEFQNVSFGYIPDQTVLRDVNVTIPAGTRVGIVGRTGAGKSTLVHLLMRFYDPTRGAILLDGIDLRDYRVADLRDQFAMVLQEPVLFSTSIAENIAYARPHTDPREIMEAARAANAHDFIMSFPEGYETRVGERGMRLSGGERQRISLARAFLKDAPILILDEPTSSVDIRTEAEIMEALNRLKAGRTTLMIAHRLSTLEKCDLMLILEDGRVRCRPGSSTAPPAEAAPSGRLDALGAQDGSLR